MASQMEITEVYETATKIGQEFQKVIETYGEEAVSDLLPMVVTALEHLENTVAEVSDLYKENSSLSDELSKVEVEEEMRRKLRKETKNLMEAVAKNEREIKEYKTIISSLKAEKEELNNRLKDYKSCSQALEDSETKVQDLSDKLVAVEECLEERERNIEAKGKKIKQLQHQIAEMSSSSVSAALNDEVGELTEKLTKLEKQLEEKDKQILDQNKQIKKFTKQLTDQKTKVNEMQVSLSHFKEDKNKLDHLKKQVEEKDCQLSEKSKKVRQLGRQLEDKVKLYEKVLATSKEQADEISELKFNLENKENMISEKNKKIKQVKLKKVFEKENAHSVSSDNVHDGQETEESSMSALLDKVANLEQEVSTLKKELSDSQTKLKKAEELSRKLEKKEEEPLKSEIASSVSNSTHPQLDSTLDKKMQNDPEFYRSDIIKILEEKTNYMMKLHEIEEKNEALKEEIEVLRPYASKRRQTSPALNISSSSGIRQKSQPRVRDIMEQSVTLRRGSCLPSLDNPIN